MIEQNKSMRIDFTVAHSRHSRQWVCHKCHKLLYNFSHCLTREEKIKRKKTTSSTIIGKFITWRGNSTLNCTRKPISHESRSDECDIGFQVQFNDSLTWNSRVRYWIFLESHNWIKIRKKKKKKTAIILRSRKPFQSQLSELSLR